MPKKIAAAIGFQTEMLDKIVAAIRVRTGMVPKIAATFGFRTRTFNGHGNIMQVIDQLGPDSNEMG
jgi:hypothetical protein